ncbi:MAG: glycosyltransferase family protein [Planctomycetota bacterium]|jgi:glucosyl-3-phosphoglycerate synthase
MTDFHQEGKITTFHDLYRAFDPDDYLVNLEERLEKYARKTKISLLLPCYFTELQNREVLDKIIDKMWKVKYLKNVVIAFNGTEEEEKFKEARGYFSALRTAKRNVLIVWVNGPRVQEVFDRIRGKDIMTGIQGKGQSVWIALGYLFARGDSDVIALHDLDIVTYGCLLLGRLIEPTANPHKDYEFCKGYYVRISPVEKMMKGRVTRLFVTPFVDAMMDLMYERGHLELGRFFDYHRMFKYPLSGEFSYTSRLAREMNIAYDWSLEVATLSEVYHRVKDRKIAQADLVPNYEHRHQELSPDDATTGLSRMVIDIAKFYLHYMRAHGIALDDSFVDMMLHTYYDNALKFIKCYSDDAEMNNLVFDRYREERTAEQFRGNLWTAWEHSRGPTEAPLIPSWNRVTYSIPDIYAHLLEAVNKDNK